MFAQYLLELLNCMAFFLDNFALTSAYPDPVLLQLSPLRCWILKFGFVEILSGQVLKDFNMFGYATLEYNMFIHVLSFSVNKQIWLAEMATNLARGLEQLLQEFSASRVLFDVPSPIYSNTSVLGVCYGASEKWQNESDCKAKKVGPFTCCLLSLTLTNNCTNGTESSSSEWQFLHRQLCTTDSVTRFTSKWHCTATVNLGRSVCHYTNDLAPRLTTLGFLSCKYFKIQSWMTGSSARRLNSFAYCVIFTDQQKWLLNAFDLSVYPQLLSLSESSVAWERGEPSSSGCTSFSMVRMTELSIDFKAQIRPWRSHNAHTQELTVDATEQRMRWKEHWATQTKQLLSNRCNLQTQAFDPASVVSGLRFEATCANDA